MFTYLKWMGIHHMFLKRKTSNSYGNYSDSWHRCKISGKNSPVYNQVWGKQVLALKRRVRALGSSPIPVVSSYRDDAISLLPLVAASQSGWVVQLHTRWTVKNVKLGKFTITPYTFRSHCVLRDYSWSCLRWFFWVSCKQHTWSLLQVVSAVQYLYISIKLRICCHAME